MFDSIQGRLACREPTRVVVEAGGIGYEIHVPLSTYEGLPAADGQVRLLLQPVVREDEWRLFGFLTAAERQTFRALVRVSGIGPVLALGLLSGLTPREFREAVAHGDVRALTRVKGIGRKTAERIVVELRDAMEPAAAGAAGRASPAGSDTQEQAFQALLALGLDAADARRRVARAGEEHPGASVGALVRAALRG